MAKYKVLKSISHNFGHSFISLMNWAYSDYIMGHIIKSARENNESKLTLDILAKSWGPTKLVTPIIAENLKRYCEHFPQLVTSSNSSMELIKEAKMILLIDLSKERIYKENPKYIENYFELTVEIIDDRDKKYISEFKDWWYPEI